MHYYDSYLRRKNIKDITFQGDIESFSQLLGLTSIYMASKLEASCHEIISLELFVKLSAGRFSEKEVKGMEIDIMFTLQWLLNPPSPQDFSILYILQLPEDIKETPDLLRLFLEVSNYIVEVAIQYNEFKHIKASEIACAATLVSLQGIKSSIIPSKEKVRYTLLENVESLNISSVKIVSIESLLMTILRRQFSDNLEEIHRNFDPCGIVYETFSDPPSLL